MLTQLDIRNLAVIEDARVEFGPGLNVLTGETGAGKSILVDALALLSGARAAGDLIRRGADRLSVVGVFEPCGQTWRESLAGAGLPSDGDQVVIRREIALEGPNRIFINDEPATLRTLSKLGAHLLRIHTQREELSLLEPETQRALLDRSAGAAGGRQVAATRRAHAAYAELTERWERLAGDQQTRAERLDLLRFQAREIDEARIRAGEEKALRAERDVLRHTESIREALGRSFEDLSEGDGAAVDRLVTSVKALRAVAEWEPMARNWAESLERLRILLEESCREIGRRLGEVESDPGRLDEIEDRLALLERLFRKYGEDSEEVALRRRNIDRELQELTLDDEGRERLEQERAARLEEFRISALELSKARHEWGAKLRDRVHRELADLAMSKARFSVELATRTLATSLLRIEGQPVDFGPAGFDEVSFQLAANPGEASGPLSVVASGGELSRVYLAVRLAVGGQDPGIAGSLVFDEVDSGIGGAEAAALGAKLRRLAESAQVFAVTHLPQVASQGHRHFRVWKAVRRGRTRMAVDLLDEASRVEEVARMLAGKKVTSLSRSHAEELLSGVG